MFNSCFHFKQLAPKLLLVAFKDTLRAGVKKRQKDKCIGGRMGGTVDSCPHAGCLMLLSCTDCMAGAGCKSAQLGQQYHYNTLLQLVLRNYS